jgi:hypothetical protein
MFEDEDSHSARSIVDDDDVSGESSCDSSSESSIAPLEQRDADFVFGYV